MSKETISVKLDLDASQFLSRLRIVGREIDSVLGKVRILKDEMKFLTLSPQVLVPATLPPGVTVDDVIAEIEKKMKEELTEAVPGLYT